MTNSRETTLHSTSTRKFLLVQSLNSPFFSPNIGAEPGRAKRRVQVPVSRKSRKLDGPEKPFVKLRPAYSVKQVFLYVVKGINIKITAKFCDMEHFRFEDTKIIMLPEKFRVFRETGPKITCIRMLGTNQSKITRPLSIRVRTCSRQHVAQYLFQLAH